MTTLPDPALGGASCTGPPFSIDQMDWCKEINDLNLLSDQEALALCAEDRSLWPVDWCSWEFTRSENLYFERSVSSAAEEFDTDRQGLYAQACKGPLLYQGRGSDFCPCKEPSFVGCSTRASEASTSDRPDYEHSVDWMDETFLNSLLEEDTRNKENPLESVNMADSMYISASAENLLTDMLIDQMSHAAKVDTSTSTGRFPVFTDGILETWGREEDSQPSRVISEVPKRSEGSAMVKDSDQTVVHPSKPTACNDNGVVCGLDEQRCLEAMVLQDLERIAIQLSDRMRVCFRDALYRLAMNSKEQHKLDQSRCSSFIDGASLAEMNDENSSMRGTGHPESKTNVIDRTVANLMFNKPCYVSPSDPWTGSLHSSMNNVAPRGSFYSLQQPVECYSYQGLTSSHS